MKKLAIIAFLLASSAFAQVNVQGTGIQLGGQVSAPPFTALTSGTNTNSTMVVGSGSSIKATGTGTIAANALNQVAVSGTSANGQVLAASSSTAATWQNVSTLFQAFTNCSTAGYVYSPANGGCVAAGVTSGGPLMVLSAPTNCSSGTCTFAPTAITSDYLNQGKWNFPDNSYDPIGYGGITPTMNALPSYGGLINIPGNSTYGDVPDFSGWKPGTIMYFRGASTAGTFTPAGGAEAAEAYNVTGDNAGVTGVFKPFTRHCFWDNYSNNDNNGISNQSTYCLYMQYDPTGPGSNFGSPGGNYTVSGWSGGAGLEINSTIPAAGIYTLFSGTMNKPGVGDHSIANWTLDTSLGAVAPQDENAEMLKRYLQENSEGTGTIASITPQANGPTLVSVPVFTGSGQSIVDTTQAVTGGSQTHGGTAPVGVTIPTGYAVATVTGVTLTPSVCSNLTQDVLTPYNSAGNSTSETFTVAAPDSGTWNTTDPMFIYGTYSENLVPTAVSGNTITANLHSQHLSGDLVCQGPQAAMGLDQPNFDPSGRHYVQYASALSANTVVEGFNATLGITNFEEDGPINLYPLALVVAGQKRLTENYWDGILRIEPNPKFAVGDAVAAPTNISGSVSLDHASQLVNSTYAYQDVQEWQTNGMESVHGHNFLGTWDVNGDDQQNLNVQISGNHNLFAPHGFSVLENNGVHTNVLADLWTMTYPPVGGQDYSNLTTPHLFGLNACWPSSIDYSKVRAIAGSHANFDLYTFAPDDAHLTYTPSQCTNSTQLTNGDGTLRWTNRFVAGTGTSLSSDYSCFLCTNYTDSSTQAGVGKQGGDLSISNVSSYAQDTISFYIANNPPGPTDVSSWKMFSNLLIGRSGNGIGWSTSATGATYPFSADLSMPTAGTVNCDSSTFGNHACTFQAGTVNAAVVQSSLGTAQTAANITISAGWGTGAAISNVQGYTNRFRFTVTAGTTPAANPTFSATFPTAFAAAPICEAKQSGGTGTVTDITGDSLETTTATGTLTWNATPVASSTYTIIVDCQ